MSGSVVRIAEMQAALVSAAVLGDAALQIVIDSPPGEHHLSLAAAEQAVGMALGCSVDLATPSILRNRRTAYPIETIPWIVGERPKRD